MLPVDDTLNYFVLNLNGKLEISCEALDVGLLNWMLFALLRQWTPCTQLQLDTTVLEVRNCTLNTENLTISMEISTLNMSSEMLWVRDANAALKHGLNQSTLLLHPARFCVNITGKMVSLGLLGNF